MAMFAAKEFFASLKPSPHGALQCVKCEIPLQESITGCRQLSDKSHVCSDCYFELMGNEIERFPIMTRRLRRA